MRKLIAGLIVLAFVVVACSTDSGGSAAPAGPSFAADSTMAKIQAAGKLVCGTKFDVVGFGFKNPTNNEVEGLDADLCRAVAEGLGVPPEFVEAISANRLPFLTEDKVDLVASTMTATDARRLEIDFSKIYYVAGQSLLVKSDSTIQTVDDLNGRKVCSGEGSTSEKNVTERAPTAELLLFKTYTEAGQALADGRCEAVSTDDTILFGLAQNIPGTELRGGVFTDEPLGIGIKKGKDDFVAFIDSTLEAMKADGRLKALYDKNVKPYTGQDVVAPF
jgi:ABC-type amino acid transport substrate-binding protein